MSDCPHGSSDSEHGGAAETGPRNVLRHAEVLSASLLTSVWMPLNLSGSITLNLNSLLATMIKMPQLLHLH